jgi:hypothetical protein
MKLWEAEAGDAASGVGTRGSATVCAGALIAKLTGKL